MEFLETASSIFQVMKTIDVEEKCRLDDRDNNKNDGPGLTFCFHGHIDFGSLFFIYLSYWFHITGYKCMRSYTCIYMF